MTLKARDVPKKISGFIGSIVLLLGFFLVKAYNPETYHVSLAAFHTSYEPHYMNYFSALLLLQDSRLLIGGQDIFNRYL